MREHHYALTVAWTGNRGVGTVDHRAYGREHRISAPAKPDVYGSSDPAFRGDPARWNPEELLVASLAQCHMLWFLSLAASAGIVVTGYTDRPTGTMAEEPSGAGQFTEVTLNPDVTVRDRDTLGADLLAKIESLHQSANEMCFIARSVNFAVRHRPTTRIER
ncbi:OsmC family peroxiredoxin [Rhodococcus spelaei]|uniref:OsmC family peroxiredoxin n=1 Tax=Rhodococcus spelaei TaxID=2546320 RepID=A0A541B8A3_9NOCA|nr:OsmC family protein [Rhodococcus spelaei]TQF68554.1 OsmC family peroxiredoxin [Rhodococcus spelaei]